MAAGFPGGARRRSRGRPRRGGGGRGLRGGQPPDDTPPGDPFSGELADIARSGAREWERDLAAWESDAEALRLRSRSLVSLLWEAMQRGDRVSITVGEHVFAGDLQAARRDLVLMGVGGATVAVNAAAIDVVALQRHGGGVSGDRTYGSLRSYLGMLEVEGIPARFVGNRFDISGRVLAVAVDHVLVAQPGGEHGVPLGALGAVIV